MDLKEINGRLEVELPGAVDLTAALELRNVLVEALSRESAADIVLKSEFVERLSTAAIQVILAAGTAAREASRRLGIEGASEAVAATFNHLGLAADLHTLTNS
jgi:chemotaxis protein CheX